jgi:hypothetical protein
MARSWVVEIGSILIGLIGFVNGPASAVDLPCGDFLRMHGMLRKAAAACRFSAYNPAIVDRAHVCFDALGSRRGAEEMYAGAAQFEHMLSVRSSEAVCATLARTFSMVIRP